MESWTLLVMTVKILSHYVYIYNGVDLSMARFLYISRVGWLIVVA